MTTFYRRPHWRTNADGTQSPVRGHVVTRPDWTRWSSAAPIATSADGRVWWSRETASPSFTRPNARCPVCHDIVFFYQSPYGGRVFFDELGPPWPKHPCTDNGARAPAAPLHPEQRAAWRRDWRLLSDLRLYLAVSSAQLVGRTEDGSRVRLEIDAAALGPISRFGYLRVDNGARPILATIDPVKAEPVEFEVTRTASAARGRIADRHRQLFEADYRRLPKSLRRRFGLPAFTKLRPDVMSLWAYRSEPRVAFVIPAYLEEGSTDGAPARVVTRVVRPLRGAVRIARCEAPNLEVRAFVLIRDHFGDALDLAIDQAYHQGRPRTRLPITFINVTAGSAAVVGPDRFEYKIFTREFDEEVAARDLVDDAALARLKAALLDVASGSRIAADLDRLVPSLVPDSLTGCAVSFLVDNSGSKRGAKIKAAAIAVHRLAGMLEAAGARVEVLGFTTKSSQGGQAREAWLRAGKPLNPGRLNDLRHVVYKAADQPMARAGAAFAVMLREGLLKENIDGEALLWAYERLRRIRAHRRVLVLLSDGAPVDDGTLNANRPDYLNQHLRRVVRRLERRPKLDLVAVGLGYDPKEVFSNATIAREPDRLGSVLARLLSRLFDR